MSPRQQSSLRTEQLSGSMVTLVAMVNQVARALWWHCEPDGPSLRACHISHRLKREQIKIRSCKIIILWNFSIARVPSPSTCQYFHDPLTCQTLSLINWWALWSVTRNFVTRIVHVHWSRDDSRHTWAECKNVLESLPQLKPHLMNLYPTQKHHNCEQSVTHE